MSFLSIERGQFKGMRIEIKNFPAIIGRDHSCDIIIQDSEISRQHARLKRRGRIFIVEDLGSRNGTFLNGDRVINATLSSGDRLLIGGTELSFFTAEDDVRIAIDVMGFDAIIDEKAGLLGPIGLPSSGKHSLPKNAQRIDPTTLANKVLSNNKAITEVFNYHTNLMIVRDLNEICLSLIKGIGHLSPSLSRAAMFIWSEKSRSLIPYAQKQFKKSASFLLSQKSFEDALNRRQVIILSQSAKGNGPKKRVVLPVSHNDAVVALIHLEFDIPPETIAFRKELETSQALINRAAPILGSLLLRKELDSWLFGIIDTIISTVEAKDTYTRGHSERVSSYCMAVADELQLNKEVKKLLMISSLCHDIGKIGIPDAILKKASLLSAEEYAEMQLHPVIGANIIGNLPNAQRIISGVKYHHEKWDGTGYPEGLMGEEIPFFGRIVAIADVFDAMISGRSYSGFIDDASAINRLSEEAELFDPEILKAFIRAYENGTLSPKTATHSDEPFTSADDDEPAPITTTKKLK